MRRLTNGTLHVVHVAAFPVEPEWFTSDASIAMLPLTFQEDLLRDLNKALENQVRRCEVTAQTQILTGNNQKTLAKFVADTKADLLIMGHKGSGGALHLMGSFTTRMLATNEIPLLVIHRPLEVTKVAGLVEPEHPLKRIFTATEEFGFLFSAAIEFVSVWQDIGAVYTGPFPIKASNYARFSEEEKLQMKSMMEQRVRELMDPHSKALVRAEVVGDKSVSGALVRIMEEEKVDLAVLTRNRHNLIEKIFIGSVARRVLENYKGNILVLPPEK